MPKSLLSIFAAVSVPPLMNGSQAAARSGAHASSAIRWQVLRRLWAARGVPTRLAAIGCRGAPNSTAISSAPSCRDARHRHVGVGGAVGTVRRAGEHSPRFGASATATS